MSFADTAVLFVLALLLFGPKKLPGIARQVGKALNEFKRASNEFKAQIESEINQLEIQERQKAREKERDEAQKILPPAPPSQSIESSPRSLPSVDSTDGTQGFTSAPQEITAATAPDVTNV